MQEKTASGGLKWVRPEVLAGLERVRQALVTTAAATRGDGPRPDILSDSAQVTETIWDAEPHTRLADGPPDDSPPGDALSGDPPPGDPADAVTTLFEIRGTLLALPFPAAATLAEEMQRAAEALVADAVTDPVQARAALSLASVQLADYLARLEAGVGDRPLTVLPSINDLRRSRGQPPMTAAELLLPASVLTPNEPLSPEVLIRLQHIARKVRPHFHRYLVRWFGKHDPEAGLLGLARIFNQLRRYFKDGPVQELFLAAEGVIEGLLNRTIIGDAACKALIGRIDRVLKPLAATREPRWPHDVASVLLSDLLAQLSQVPADSPVLQELERAFGRRLASADDDAMQAADSALLLDGQRQELTAIAALLPANARGDDLKAAATRLQRLCETLALLGQEALAARLARGADTLTTLAATPLADTARVAAVRDTLAQVDLELHALGDMSRAATPNPAQGANAEALAATAPAQNTSVNLELLALFLDEADTEIATISSQFQRWCDDRADPQGLHTLGRSLRSLQASGRLVGAQHIADLARVTGTLIERLLDGALAAEDAVPGYLAAVIEALPEAALAAVEQRPPEHPDLLARGLALLHSDPATTDADADADPDPNDPAPPTSLLATSEFASRPAPRSEDLTVEPLSATRPSQDFNLFALDPQSTWQAPRADGLLVETMELNSSIRAAFGASEPTPLSFETVPAVVEDDVAYLDEADLSEVFIDDARKLVGGLDRWLRQHATATPTALATARRQLLTLKGSARRAGLAPIGDLGHALWTLLETHPKAVSAARPDSTARATAGPAPAPTMPPASGNAAETSLLPLLQQVVATLTEQVEAVAMARPVPIATALIDALETFSSGRAPVAAALTLPPLPLDVLIDQAGEIGAYRARLMQQHSRLGLRQAQLDAALGQIERDLQPPDRQRARHAGEAHTASVAPLLDEARELLGSIGDLQRDNLDLLKGQSRLIAGLKARLLGTRMVPFARFAPPLQRLVQQAAAGLHKDLELTIDGGDVAVDRTVLERFLVPLEHLLRNAVVHGIESPAIRQQQGKPPRGTVSIRVTRRGDDILIDLADDGAGMDPAQVRAHAEDRGLIAPGATLSDQAILDLTLTPGFSAADTVTHLAGRGAGLDLVKAEITALNGELTLTSRPGVGVNLSIRLPGTLSIVDALPISAGGALYALPDTGLLALARIERARVAAASPGEPISLAYRGAAFPVVSLATALQDRRQGGSLAPAPLPAPLPGRRWLPLLLMQAGTQRVAFQIDALLDRQRVMVKPIGPPLGALPWLTGGALLPDGRVALLLDLPALLHARPHDDGDVALMEQVTTRPQTPGERTLVHGYRVLVLANSARIRQHASALQARGDIELLMASDEPALRAVLRRETPDLLLLDAGEEPPDHAALLRQLRADPRLHQVPVILLAAHADARARRQAIAHGADRVLAEPIDDLALLAELDAVLPPSAGS